MSVCSEVQRTLVKSPPELWAELSDPATLGRHLGELGEIRILRTDPERTVDWEAAAADGAEVSGKVEIEPSGWGTRVTLSASRAVTASEPEPDPEPAPEPEATQPEPSAPVPETPAEPEPEPAVEPESESQVVNEPEPRRGFFARFFRRRRTEQAPVEPRAAVEAEAELAVDPEPEPPAAVEIEEPAPEETVTGGPASDESTPETDIAAELTELEQRTTAVLTGVLDRLGAAHHRPFSRA